MKYIFFLIIFLIPMGIASAESGANYDRINNPDGTTTITILPYDRIVVDWQWKNYNFINDATTVTFESGSAGFKLDKLTCDFKLYEAGRIVRAPVIDNYRMEYFKDSLPVISTCLVLTPEIKEKEVVLTTQHNGITRIFHLNVNGVEWTTEYTNNDGKDILFRIKETIPVLPDRIEGDKLYYGDYLLDLKNEQHDSLKSITNDKGDLIIEYEKTVATRELLKIDPTFNEVDSASSYLLSAGGTGGSCPAYSTFAGGMIIRKRDTTDATPSGCSLPYFLFDASAIPAGSTTVSATLEYDITAVTNGINCDLYIPSTATPSATMYNDGLGLGAGTLAVDNFSSCTTIADGKIETFDSGSYTALESYMGGTIPLVIGYDSWARDASDHIITIRSADAILNIVYVSAADAVTDLASVDIRGTAVDLSWSQPALNGFTFDDYQINYTTPWSSNVATQIVPSTTQTTATISSLTGETQYSFRIGIRTTNGNINASGNVLNITTLYDPTGAFTIGTFNLTQVGTDERPIRFARTDISDTALFLNVTVSNDWDLACNFHYKFANTNKTYTGIANTTFDSNYDAVAFRFNDIDNEIVDVLCWDQYTNDTGRYLITQSAFPLLTYIQDFRGGEFGTSGMFGAIDFITMVALILSMVGFNSRSPIVGVVFSVAILAGLAVFQIIQIETVAITGIVITFVFAIGMIRKDD
jgi:hypothetical protein